MNKLKLSLCSVIVLVVAITLVFLEHERRQGVVTTIPILTYHEVLAAGEVTGAVLVLDVEVFTTQLQTLKDRGYETISMADLAAYARFKKLTLPNKPIILTFDDTWRGHYTNVLPVLESFDYTATFYINSGWVGSSALFMTWDEVRALQSAGMEIGGHTVHHTELKRSLTLENLEAEIIADKAHIEAEISTTIDTFAYPYNTFTTTAIDMLQTIGYTTARTGPAPEAPATLHTLPSFIIESTHLPPDLLLEPQF